MTAQSLDYNQLVASVCRDSFYEFVKEHWDTVITTDPIWNWHIEYLCDELQKIAERVFKGEKSPYDLVVNIPPGTTKSTICSEMFPAWVWTRMPHAQFICASYTAPVAYDLARRCKDIVTSDKYKRYFPDVVLRSDATIMLLTEQGGFRLAVGTGGVTGFHAHFILVDDPLDPQAAGSKTGLDREKALDWMTGTLATRKVDKEVTCTILIMQRLHQADPSALMLGQIAEKSWGGKVKHICLPWRISTAIRPQKLMMKYVDGLLDPVRLSKAVGETYRAKLGSFGFSCQFDQSPVPLEGGMFKTDRIVVDVPPAQFKRVVRFWDKAGTILDGDWTVGLKMGEDKSGRFWILDIVRGQWDSDEREQIIRRTAMIDGRAVKVGIEVEPGSGGKESGENTQRRTLAGFAVMAERATGDKAVRADPFSVQVNARNVFIAANCPNIPAYIEELKYFPAGTHDDMVDASSGAFSMLFNRRVLGAHNPPTEQEISQHKHSQLYHR